MRTKTVQIIDLMPEVLGVIELFMNEQYENPFPSVEGQQSGGVTYANDQYEIMRIQMSVRDDEHLKLMAILHYVWAGLVGLGAIICIGYIFMMGSIFEAMESDLTTTPATAPVPSSPSTDGATPEPVEISFPVIPERAPGSSVASSPGPSADTTYTTGRSAGLSSGMYDSMLRMMYIIYGTFAGLCLVGCICNILSARFMQKRKHRVFSLVVSAINVLMIPLGTILGIFTFIVLCRQSVAQKYTPVDLFTQRDPR